MDSNKKYDETKQKQVVEMISEGKTFAEACQAVGISRTLEWLTRKENPDYDKAIDTAKELRTQAVEGKLYDECMKGNITAIIFYLKTHNPKKYNIKMTHFIEERKEYYQCKEIQMI